MVDLQIIHSAFHKKYPDLGVVYVADSKGKELENYISKKEGDAAYKAIEFTIKYLEIIPNDRVD